MPYRAFVVNKTDDDFSAAVATLDDDHLPEGDVTIRVHWSSVNYKDGLAATPNGRVIRKYPMVPGVDLAGVVESSSDGQFQPGDEVFVTGYDIGVSHPGGFAEKARVPAEWVLKVPEGLTMKETMALGTAGFTAALSVEALEQHGLRQDAGPVIVTGATGGVGSTAVSMLASLGYQVAASTGKESEHKYLTDLGAKEILPRDEVMAESNRPIEAERWAGAVDPVGGAATAYLARTMKYGASIALSGNTGGPAIPTTVFPYILRGVNLLGIESVYCPIEKRERVWHRCGDDLKPRELMDSIASEVDLDGLHGVLGQIVQGKVKGRVLVKLA